MSKDLFDLSGRVAVITGAAGLLGWQHSVTIASFGGTPIMTDIDPVMVRQRAAELGGLSEGLEMDVTREQSLVEARDYILTKYGTVDILINNAARNPKVTGSGLDRGRFEDFSAEEWERDLRVGLTGAMLASKVFGTQMAKQKRGVILNIASDLALIGPDQRLYEKPECSPEEQPKKPVSYNVVKSGLVGLTRYLATYWAKDGVRVNALCPGGVENGQAPDFLAKIREVIPMGRMARPDEYQGAVAFAVSGASGYMTGAILVVDGGRTCW